MFIMFTITISALILLVWQNARGGNYALASMAAGLFILAIVLIVDSVRSLLKTKVCLPQPIEK
jgi:ABC-type phosphate transport system permease subunit